MSSFLDKLADSWPCPQWCDVTVVAAVSGGADSVALLCGLAALRQREGSRRSIEGRLAAVHFNHRLRGEESDADARFVQALGDRLGVPLVVGEAESDLRAQAAGEGLEGAARQARYEFLTRTADQLGARYVATAHTADDQVETILHRILRGTGIAGLAGIPRTRPLSAAATLIRPLLGIRRSELLAYLSELGQNYCRDATNEDLSLTRNRIRHELLPLLAQQWNPQVHDALWRLGSLAAEAQSIIDEQVAALFQACVVSARGDSVTIDMLGLRSAPPYLVRELLLEVWRRQAWPQQQMGFDEWSALAATAQNEPAAPLSRDLPMGIRAEYQNGRLQLRREAG